MAMLEDLEIGRQILYSDCCFSGDYNQELYLRKAAGGSANRPIYYIYAISYINGGAVKQGYIYFYLDFVQKASYFIGVQVQNQYRNLNIGSFLVATWIDLCLNSGYDFLGVNRKQRKPFLLYLLKTYGFEILDKTQYETRPDVISICRSVEPDDKRKFLLFRDSQYEKSFMKSIIYRTDNYEVVHHGDNIIPLDDVILRTKYQLFDENLAEAKSQMVISRHRK